MSSRAEVLLYVEDPGAANFVADLVLALGDRARLYAGGVARVLLDERGVAWLPLELPPAELLARQRPALVLVGTAENPETPGLALVDAARAAGIESAAVVDAPQNAEHRFRGRGSAPLAHAPDWILVPDEQTRASYVGLGHPSARALVTGHPQWDRVLQLRAALEREGRAAVQARALPEMPAGAPLVVFLAEISDGFGAARYRRSADYTLAGRGGADGRTEIVLEELLDALAALPRRPSLALRLHPKNDPAEFAAYREELDAISIGGPPYALVFAADLVVGMTTTLLAEAVLLGRPTLAVLPREAERAWLPPVAAEATPVVTTRTALRRELTRLLAGQAAAPPPAAAGAVERLVAFVAARTR